MLTFAFMHHPYLVCILFGMPSLHLFTFLNVFYFLVYLWHKWFHFELWIGGGINLSCGFLSAVLRDFMFFLSAVLWDFMFFLSFCKPHCAAVRKLEFWMSNTTMTVLHNKPLPRVTSCYSVHQTLVSSPDPTLSRGETVWWTNLNFLG